MLLSRVVRDVFRFIDSSAFTSDSTPDLRPANPPLEWDTFDGERPGLLRVFVRLQCLMHRVGIRESSNRHDRLLDSEFDSLFSCLLDLNPIEAGSRGSRISDRLQNVITRDRAAEQNPRWVRQVGLVLHLIVESGHCLE